MAGLWKKNDRAGIVALHPGTMCRTICRTMWRTLCCVLLCCAVLCCTLLMACGKKPEEEPLSMQFPESTEAAGNPGSEPSGGQDVPNDENDDFAGGEDAGPGGADTQSPAGQNSAGQSPAAMGQNAMVSVLDTVAYPLDGMLYGGIAYMNTGSSPIILTEATFTFTYQNGTQTNTFVPEAAQSNIVNPGETAYCTLWLAYAGNGALPETVSVTAELTCAAAQARQRPLAVSNARLIQNYPGFATLSGRLMNPAMAESGLSMIYVGFYDKDDKLVGVWYFSRNTVLQPGSGTAFVVHLRSFRAPGLAEKTARMEFRAFSL